MAIEESGSSRRKKNPQLKLAAATLPRDCSLDSLVKTKASRGRNAIAGRMLNRLTKDSVTPERL